MPCSPRPTSCRPRRCAECAAVNTAAASENRDWPARVQAAAARISSLVERVQDKVAGVIICGGNLSANVLAQVRRT